jgi:hypothetical protein
MERGGDVVEVLQGLVDYSFGAPSAARIPLAGVEFEGECAPAGRAAPAGGASARAPGPTPIWA